MHVSKLLGSNITTFVIAFPVGLITSEVELCDIDTVITDPMWFVSRARVREFNHAKMVCSLFHFAFVAKVEKFHVKLFIKSTPNAFAESYINLMLRCSDSSFSPKSHDVTNIFSRVSEQFKPRWWARASVYVIITRLHPPIIRIITFYPSFFTLNSKHEEWSTDRVWRHSGSSVFPQKF